MTNLLNLPGVIVEDATLEYIIERLIQTAI